jgi:hypothetical protein
MSKHSKYLYNISVLSAAGLFLKIRKKMHENSQSEVGTVKTQDVDI